MTAEDIIITHELISRPRREPDFRAENKTFIALGKQLNNKPEKLLNQLVRDALRLKLCVANKQITLLSRKFVKTQDEERHQLAKALHDEMRQSLTTLKLLLE